MIRVLLVDDEKNFIDGISMILEDYDCACTVAYDGLQGLDALGKDSYDVIVTDLIMPNMDGIAFLREAHALYPEIPSIVMTAHGGDNENRTVRALGAKNFILKPVDVAQLANMIDNLHESSKLAEERDLLKEKLQEREQKSDLSDLLGKSPASLQLSRVILQVAPTNLSILITGESGVGKQVVAESIHRNSLRKDSVFVDAHCASFSQTLLEDELFGHEKGAYTGATSRKKGIFEKANGGTLFLDEIGEIPLSTQVKLLKVIEEHRFLPLGSDRERESDFRLICATNRDLEEEIRKGNFREDLYYRINKMNIVVPSLRDRESDIPFLCNKFLRKFSREYHGERGVSISSEAMNALCAYSWPGNVRELENVMERLVVMSKSEEISFDDLPFKILKAASEAMVSHRSTRRIAEFSSLNSGNSQAFGQRWNPDDAGSADGDGSFESLGSRDIGATGGEGNDSADDSISVRVGTMQEMESQIINELLRRNRNNKSKVAKMLGINRKTLLSRVKSENG